VLPPELSRSDRHPLPCRWTWQTRNARRRWSAACAQQLPTEPPLPTRNSPLSRWAQARRWPPLPPPVVARLLSKVDLESAPHHLSVPAGMTACRCIALDTSSGSSRQHFPNPRSRCEFDANGHAGGFIVDAAAGADNSSAAARPADATAQNAPPDRPPDVVLSEQTGASQAALYRLSGDLNPVRFPGSEMRLHPGVLM